MHCNAVDKDGPSLERCCFQTCVQVGDSTFLLYFKQMAVIFALFDNFDSLVPFLVITESGIPCILPYRYRIPTNTNTASGLLSQSRINGMDCQVQFH